MVHGLAHFGQRLSAYKDHFVLVGGSAADLLMTEIGGNFRATKDLDIVVFMRPDPAFLKALAEYIKDGNYGNKEKSEGETQFYRFNKPEKAEFPKQIELFSKKPEDLDLFEDQHIIPIQKVEAGSQFSGILLEDEYYELIKANTTDGEHAKYITAVAQIPLKARAFNELRERKEKHIDVSDDDIKKHRNDILVLSGALTVGGKFKLVGLPLNHLEIYLQEVSKLENDQGILEVCKKKNLSKLSEIMRAIKDYYF
jgi:hypothetical protein